jgi:hypothetical protein
MELGEKKLWAIRGEELGKAGKLANVKSTAISVKVRGNHHTNKEEVREGLGIDLVRSPRRHRMEIGARRSPASLSYQATEVYQFRFEFPSRDRRADRFT